MRNFTLHLCFVLFFAMLKVNFASEQRIKRFVTFPYRHVAVMQIIAGIGIPVELELESVTMGWVFKSQFYLPMNATDFTSFFGDPFDVTPHPISTFFDGRKRSVRGSDKEGFDSEQNERYEKHEVDVDVVESNIESNANEEDENLEEPHLATVRWTVYKGLAALAENNGLPGRPCVLRSICESAHTSFDYSNGVFGELMHVILSPSATNDEIKEHADYEYFRAEKLGKEGAPCEQVFNECKLSILQKFGGIYSPHPNISSNKLFE